MNRKKFINTTSLGTVGILLNPLKVDLAPTKSIGIIGLDTSHSPAFTRLINDASSDFKVTHAYPFGSKTIESSYSRIPKYTEEVKELGLIIVNSIAELLQEVDFVLLETNDGRLHLRQAEAVFKAGKPVFIDKPLAASFDEALRIYELSEQYQVPFFSASSLRFGPTTMEVAQGKKIGKVLAADIYSPAKLEPTHPDLFWYGIHGVESLFTVMGTGCKTVQRLFQPDADLVIGRWKDGRVGTFRGLRKGKTSYGGTAFGSEGISPAGIYEGYEHLVKAIIQFFKTGVVPVKKQETLEIFAFMAAAEESKRKKGKVVELAKYLKRI